MAETRTVRTTIAPDVEIEVDDTEYLDLKRQGLLHEQEVGGEHEANEDEAPARQPYHSRKKSTAEANADAETTKES